jgi:hypothetical protein
MEAFSLSIAAVGLIAVGCASAVLSLCVYPLKIRVQGQPHGRFAGLSSATAPTMQSGRGIKRRIDALGRLIATPSGLVPTVT